MEWLIIYDKLDNNESMKEFKEFMQHAIHHKKKSLE